MSSVVPGSAEGRPVSVPLPDGGEIAGRWWEAAGSAGHRVTTIIAPALGVRQELYGPFAAHLAARGIGALTFDYRGMGASLGGRSVRGAEDDLRAWGRGDVRAVLDWHRRREAPGSGSLAYLGHSMGIPLLGLADPAEVVDAVVAVAAPHAYWKNWSGLQRLPLWLTWHLVIPGSTRLLGYFPGEALGLGADLPPKVALQWARWARHPEYLVDEDGRPLRRGFRRIDAPLLAVSSREDRYSPPEAVEPLLEFFPRARIEHRVIEGRDVGVPSLGHLDFFRDPPGPALWDEIVEWILAACAGADHEQGAPG